METVGKEQNMQQTILNLLPVTEEEKRQFEALAPDAVHTYAGRRSVTQAQLDKATVIFGWPREGDLKRAPNLKWFQTMWAGADEYLEEGVLPSGVTLTSSSGSNKRSVAEHMLASVLSLCRRLPQYRDSQREHIWSDEGKMKTLLDATVLVVGTGNIGALFAQMCKAMGAYTIGVKRTVTGAVEGFDEVYPVEKLDELLPRADVVAMVLPHSPQTQGMMGKKQFDAMKEDAIFINCGRGSAVDAGALAQVMKEGKLWGAALDVTQPEPLPKDSPLWDIPNLLLTPHVAGGMRLEITRAACVKMAMDNLERYLKGETLNNVVAVGK